MQLKQLMNKKAGRALAFTTAAVLTAFIADADLFNHAMAASDAGGVFDKGAQKGNDIADAMKGKIAVTITGLVIGVVGILMQLGRVQHTIGVRIIAGAIVVGSCMGIAEFLYA